MNPYFQKYSLPLKIATDPQWVKAPLADFDLFLQDHAACEKKASALAMSMIAKYPDREVLVDPMVSLAREELDHFRRVYQLMSKRGVKLASSDEKDVYVGTLLKELRHGRNERFLDRLVCSAVVEARGFERFHLVADGLEEGELKSFYHELAESEAGHYMIFIRIARHYFDERTVSEAVERISTVEAKVLAELPHRAALH